MGKKAITSLTKFKEDVSFTILKAKKALVCLESFDYSYIIEVLCSLESNGWIWNESTGIVLDLRTKATFNVNGQTILRTDTLCESIKNFSAQPGYKILIARVSEKLFASEPKLTSLLQDFVYDNNQKNDSQKQTIVLISNAYIAVPGLEHICERFALPLPDIEDIDEEFGLIQDGKLKTLRDIHPEVHPDDDKILEVGEDYLNLVSLENVENSNYYCLFNPKIGFIRRDENGRVERIILPQDCKYKFGSGFLSRQEKKISEEKHEINLETRYQELVESLSGMYLYDIKELLTSIIIKGDGRIKSRSGDQTLTKTIRERKKQIANNSGLLEVIDYDKEYWRQVADIDNLLSHINDEMGRIDSPSSYPPKFPKPKGILLVGAPGCGKSESAKAIASKLDKPLYRLNISNLLGHKYGQSENRFIEALHTADASAPCVLWIDEIEKAFAGAGNESENDDTLTHIVGHFLTWMQEHKTMVYLVATANDISRMKPEMLRKGRWDETFYLRYPSFDGCKTIMQTISKNKFEINLKETGDEVNIDIIANVMCRIPMSGAEIENVIVETVKKHPLYENGNWCVNIEDVALTLFNYLSERKEFEERDIDIDEDKIEERDFQYIKNKLIDYSNCKDLESIDNNGEKTNASSLLKRVDKEILEIKIQNCGRISDEDVENLRNLLMEKYKNEESKDGRSKNMKDKDDLFLSMKVDKEILEMRIQNFGRISDEDLPSLRNLLMEKYKKQYNFKSASISKIK